MRVKEGLSRKRLLVIAIGCCIVSAAYLASWTKSGAQSARAISTSTPAPGFFAYLPFVLKNHISLHYDSDWVVTGVEMVENAEILLGGNLTVQNGGSLTLRNVRLTLNGAYHGEYGIQVETGGTMTIEAGSVIAAARQDGHYSFVVETGSQFAMRESALHGCGWGSEWQGPGDPVEPVPISWDVAGLYIQADSAVLERNTFSGNFGALILDAQGVQVRENEIQDNILTPISILGAENVFENNKIYHLPATGFARCIDISGRGNIVAGNTCFTEREPGVLVGGIYLLNAWDNLITGNTFTVTTAGIAMSTAMDSSSNNVITGNVISTWESGINIHGRNNLVAENTIRHADTGIEVMYAYENVIAGNTLFQIGIMHGIRLTHSSGNTVTNNHIAEVDSDGVFVWDGSQDNLFQGNVISGTLRGMAFFYRSDGNVIRDNTVTNTGSMAIFLDDTAGNLIYRNNFSGAGQSPFDDGVNQWDDGSQGNYWSDYNGSDGDGDGIGDTPYEIVPNGEDRYPLMEPVTPEAGVGSRPPSVAYQEPLERINITTVEVWENQALTLETQITIQDGGSLTLRNVTMTLGSEAHDAFIWVNPGGALYIYDSHFEESKRGYGGRITLMRGATLVMENTYLQGIRYDWWNGGFEVFCDQVTLIGNTMTGVDLQLYPTKSATVISNTISYALAPLWVGSGEAITITGNIIDGSIWWGVLFSAPEGQEVLIANNVFSDTVGGTINLWTGEAVVMGNTISHGRGTAIEVNSGGNLISNNAISDFENGISIAGASNNRVIGNTLSRGWGSAIDVNGDSNLVSHNIIPDFYQGINVHSASNNQVLSNTLSNGQKGIVLSHSSANIVAYNQLTGLTDDPSTGVLGEALVLFESDGNMIVTNMLANSSCGAVLESNSTNNVLFHNNFMDNAVQVWDYCTGNQWDNGSEGNYWSDYAGSDDNGDGIGDMPYVISPDEMDRYPLMAPYGGLSLMASATPCLPAGSAMVYLDNGGGVHNSQCLMGHVTLCSTEVYLWSTDRRAAAGSVHQGLLQHLAPGDIGAQGSDVLLIDHRDHHGHLACVGHRLAISWPLVNGDRRPHRLPWLQAFAGDAVGLHQLQEFVHEQPDHPGAAQAGELPRDEANDGLTQRLGRLRPVLDLPMVLPGPNHRLAPFFPLSDDPGSSFSWLGRKPRALTAAMISLMHSWYSGVLYCSYSA